MCKLLRIQRVLGISLVFLLAMDGCKAGQFLPVPFSPSTLSTPQVSQDMGESVQMCPSDLYVPLEDYLGILLPEGAGDSMIAEAVNRPLFYYQIYKLLNEFGSGPFIDHMVEYGQNHFKGSAAQLMELTGDEVPEVIVFMGFLDIFTCMEGKYQLMNRFTPEGDRATIDPQRFEGHDYNDNGIHELFVDLGDTYHGLYEYHEGRLQPILWDGSNPQVSIRLGANGFVKFLDLDLNGTYEMWVINRLVPEQRNNPGAWIQSVEIYRWRTEMYLLTISCNLLSVPLLPGIPLQVPALRCRYHQPVPAQSP